MTSSYLDKLSTDDSINITKLLKSVWIQKWFISKITFVVAVVSVIYTLNIENVYSSHVTMLPHSVNGSKSQLSGLAALAGIDVNSTLNNEAFYQDVLFSDNILNKAVSRKWYIADSISGTYLHEVFDLKLNSAHFNPEEKLRYDIKQILRNKVISFTSSKENGLMRLTVSIPRERALSAIFANWLASELHEFNERHRAKKALDNVSMVKKQLMDAKDELTKAENALSNFQSSNKNYIQSNELKLIYERLQREVFTENAVYTELRKQYEIAKIEAEKRKETITILDPAVIPMVKSSPKRGLICIFITLIGFIFSIVISLFKKDVSGKV